MHILEEKIRAARAAGRHALIPFVTFGFPDEKRFWPALVELDESGADIIEIGVPFSDPVADGPVVEEASRRVLSDGVCLARIMEELKLRAGVFRAIRAGKTGGGSPRGRCAWFHHPGSAL